ncbi:MAG: hypothetical protein MUE96_05640 [Bacteroidia bacterium]|jgi:hypothetical protein|nr:hypothetical protein [Bacteroidia bacterium]
MYQSVLLSTRNKALAFMFTVVLFVIGNALHGQALTGTKNVPGDFATLKMAIDTLNTNGVGTGGVTITINAGYTETITSTLVLTATGTATNPIVFQKTGVGTNPTITAYTGGTATPASAVPDGILALSGSDWVTIDGINFQDNAANTTAATTMEYGIGLFKASATNGCQNNTIQNCAVTLNRVNWAAWAFGHNGSICITVFNSIYNAANTSLTVTAASGSNSYNKFYSNTLQNCNAGIAFNGFAAPSPYTLGDTLNDVGGTSALTGNTVINFGGGTLATQPATGIFAKDQWGLNISYNTINSNNGAGVNHPSTLRGIFHNASSVGASTTIRYNTVTVKGGGTTSQVTGIENGSGNSGVGNC